MRAKGALAAALLVGIVGLFLTGCGNSYTVAPAPANPLEGLMAVRNFPIFWLGERFGGLTLAEVTDDYSGAVRLGYGQCLQGGQYSCQPPLTVVTSPEDTFLPHGQLPLHPTTVRGVRAYVTADGRTYELPSADVVVVVYAQYPALAKAAVGALATLNGALLAGEPLFPPTPSAKYAATPLATQLVVIRRRRRPRPAVRGCPPARRLSCG